MSEETYPAELQAIIDRAGALTAAEAKSLGELWESGEDLFLPDPSIALEAVGIFDLPMAANEDLLAAWQRALDVASAADRVDVLDAARAAGRATKRDIKHLKDSENSLNGAEEAVRSAVLAVGVRDLIPDEDFQVLVAPWQQTIGTL